jgi:hypothetical protein
MAEAWSAYQVSVRLWVQTQIQPKLNKKDWLEVLCSCTWTLGSACWGLFFFFSVLGLELRVYALATPPALFCEGFFWDRILQTVCPVWLQTSILLISASWAARFTGVSHWRGSGFCCCFGFFMVLGVELGVLFCAQGSLDGHPSVCTPLVAGMTGTCHCKQLLVEMESHELFP